MNARSLVKHLFGDSAILLETHKVYNTKIYHYRAFIEGREVSVDASSDNGEVIIKIRVPPITLQ